MNKKFKALVSAFLAVVLLCTSIVPAFAVETAPAAPENLVVNGDFSADETGNNPYWMGIDGKLFGEIVEGEVNGESNRYLQYTFDYEEPQRWKSVTFKSPVIEPNTTYVMSFDYKIETNFTAGDEAAALVKDEVVMQAVPKPTTKVSIDNKIMTNVVLVDGASSNGWQHFTTTFDNVDATQVKTSLKIDPIGVGGTLCVDNVSVTKVVPTVAPVVTVNYDAKVADKATTSLTGSVDVNCQLSYTLNGGAKVPVTLTDKTFAIDDIDLVYGENKIVFTADNGLVSTKDVVINRTFKAAVEKPELVVDVDNHVYQSTYYVAGSVDSSAKVYYTLNGSAEKELTITDGKFSEKVMLTLGDNEITVKAVPFENGEVYNDLSSTTTYTVEYESAEYVTDNPENVWNWDNVELNGMGWVTGIVTSETAPYQMYVKTDVGGAYRFNRDTDRWEAITDQFGMDNRSTSNIESIAVDPNDGDTVYIACNSIVYQEGKNQTSGQIFVSHDAGRTWESTGLENDCPGVWMDANDGKVIGGDRTFRQFTAERLAVDPNNTDIVYFGSRVDGLYKYDGESWSKVETGIVSKTPAANTNGGNTVVVFDKNSGTVAVDGKMVTKTMYVGMFDIVKKETQDTEINGMYRSQDGGVTWEKLATEGNTVIGPQRAAVNEDGVLVVSAAINNTSGSAWRMDRDSDTLTELISARGKKAYLGVDVMPDGKSFILGSTGEPGTMYYVENGGTEYKSSQATIGKKIQYTEEWCHGTSGPMAADLADPTGNTIYATTGFGVLRTTNYMTDEVSVWDDHTIGLDELVVNSVKAAPVVDGCDLHIAAWDMGGFSVVDRDEMPDFRLLEDNVTDGAPEWGGKLTQVTNMDYSGLYPSYMAYVGYHENGYYGNYAFKFGTTTDGGKTWTETTTIRSDKATGGTITLSATNPYNMVWAPAGTMPKYSLDFGQTWQDCQFNDLITMSSSIGQTIYEKKNVAWGATQNLAADRINGDKFYLFTEEDNRTAKFFMSTDGGKTFDLTYTGHTQDEDNIIDPVTDEVDAYALPFTNVKVNPAVEGDVFIAIKPGAGKAGSDPIEDAQYMYKPLWRSTDASCTDFDKVEGIDYAIDVAFGKGDSKDVPYIYVLGSANGDDKPGLNDGDKSGLYVSKDNGETWTRISDSSQQFGAMKGGIEADMREKNIVYVATGGRGVIYGQGEEDPDTSDVYGYGWKEVYEGDLPTPDVDEEIIENGDFELDIIGSWFMYVTSQKNLVVATDVKHSGNNSILAFDRTQAKETFAQEIVNDGQIVNGQSYKASVFVKVPDGADAGDLKLTYKYTTKDSPTNDKTGAVKFGADVVIDQKTVTDEWTELTGVFTITEDVVKLQMCLVEVSTDSNNPTKLPNFYVDDFSVLPTNEKPTEPEYEIKESYSAETDTAPTVDGKLDEQVWNGGFVSIENVIKGEYNNKAQYKVVWDENGMYIAIVVEDDKLVQDSDVAHQDDAIEIYIDPENDKEGKYGIYDYQIVTRNGKDEINVVKDGDPQPEALKNMQYASSNEGNKYYFEYFIKWSDLGITEANLDMEIGFDIINIDEDVSGTLNKASWSGDDSNWTSTKHFGVVRLVEEAVGGVEPPVLEQGDGQEVEEGKDATFKSSADIDDFIEVRINGDDLDRKHYTLTEGSTIITLKADYLKTLKAGDYTIEIVSETGTVEGTFTVPEKTTAPETGDSNTMLIVLSIIATMAGAALIGLKKRAN